ncbi:helix-turn-helix domain-containing protein [Micromonospora mirobrigensis]|uniref:DNA binding domain-containing protein, excisionase family n=1 Tax=Micromonospora mirobrigensis TaxID=262898 RepID=A0A1C4YHF0_9ACTN|nr:helix-turn-helix domain-containing protein [Micromonospora mirobrigensis]SCF20066.1 DNA binding domain-containing protein, excisionase family [Micromonospora mirobrigensis]
MSDDVYSVEQVAARLDLHPRTVRGYIRAGRLRATRIGKQYRITRADLDALTGRPAPARPRSVEVSSIVQVDAVDRVTADRLGTLLLAAANTGADPGRPLRVQVVHEPERDRMRLVVLGDPAATADLLRLLDALLTDVLAEGAKDA